MLYNFIKLQLKLFQRVKLLANKENIMNINNISGISICIRFISPLMRKKRKMNDSIEIANLKC